MPIFTRFLCCLLAAIFLVACNGSDSNSNSNSNNAAIDPPIEPTEPTEPPPSIFSQMTVNIPSAANPAFTPGTPGVMVDNEKLLSQFGSADINLNQARYTRYFLSDRAGTQPDGILVLIPGFEGGASGFYLLAENLLRRAAAETNLVLEVWAFDRRSNQLEDTVGLDIAEGLNDPLVGLDFLFGDELGLELSQPLIDGPNRRAVFYNNSDIAFMAQWTPLVHSQDIDAVVEAARSAARGGNVFLGGHSAGSGFVARYAATDFNLAGGEPAPGYKKLRGLLLIEGGGAGPSSESPDEATLDMIEARFDGGLYGAVRDQMARCIDGQTACTSATAATDCAAFENTSCVQPTSAYAEIPGLTSTQLFAASEVNALDANLNDDSTLSILQRDINGSPGNNAIAQVPQLNILTALLGTTPASSVTLLGKFLDDDGLAAGVASFLATSVGFEGPVVNGIATWLSKGETMPPEALIDNGPAPATLDDRRRRWGVEVEPTDLEGRLIPLFYLGETNFLDWYYPSSGLSVTTGLGLDTTPLSAPPPLGRGRTDIDNRTQGGAIDIPVIGFGGSNGLTPVPASFLGFADVIAPCAAASCDSMTQRVLDRANPNEVFPTFGGASGGYEVYISEGYSHVDILTADDEEGNQVIAPLLDFIGRNLQ